MVPLLQSTMPQRYVCFPSYCLGKCHDDLGRRLQEIKGDDPDFLERVKLVLRRTQTALYPVVM